MKEYKETKKKRTKQKKAKSTKGEHLSGKVSNLTKWDLTNNYKKNSSPMHKKNIKIDKELNIDKALLY